MSHVFLGSSPSFQGMKGRRERKRRERIIYDTEKMQVNLSKKYQVNDVMFSISVHFPT